MGETWSVTGEGRRKVARSQILNIDNGAGTTIDECILRHSQPIRILAARITYQTETAGTIAAGNAQIGSAIAGNDIVAATAYTNGAAIGSKTAMTVKIGGATLAADTPVIVRHTGVAATAAGQARVEIEYFELT